MKKYFTLKSIFTLLLFACFVSITAQERTCGMQEYMEQQMQNPEFAREYEKRQEKFRVKLQQLLSEENFNQRGGSIIEIPVAVHFPTANEADRDCLVALAQNQIDILNADYSATNADISQWNAAMGFYPGTNLGVANISFCLALSNHPIGLDPELLEGKPAVTIGYNFGNGNNIDSNWGGYMNFVVRPIGALGFSPLGGSIAAGQAVTITNTAFGSGAGCSGSGIVPTFPYNLGRTTTHELGHFYNLNHTFNGDGNGVCGVGGDGIADTPEVANSTYNCPPIGSVAGCVSGQSALTMSYMDYGNDTCLYMFSAGQATVMDAWVASIASQIKPDVCTPAPPGFILMADNSPVFSCPTTDSEAVFNLSYTTIEGFNESTTFSASGVPPNATVTFSPTSLNSDGNFTMTIGNLGATTEGEYTISVIGTSSSSAITESETVLLKNACTAIVCDPNESPDALGLAIPDFSSGSPGVVGNIINIPNSAIIESLTVNVSLSHTFIGDLILQLQHPNGVDFANLWANNCGSENGLDITFDATASAIVCADPTVGTYAPTGLLSTFNGLDAQGDWAIVIIDIGPGDTGVLNNWSISICAEEPLSINEFSISDFTIFPNPNDGEFSVKFNSNSANAINIDVFDLRGRRIFNNAYTNGSNFNESINLNNAKPGMYLVTISDGTNKITKKIVVK